MTFGVYLRKQIYCSKNMKRVSTQEPEDKPRAKRFQYIPTQEEEGNREAIEWVELKQESFFPLRTPKFNGLRRPKLLEDIWPMGCYMQVVVFFHYDFYPYAIHCHGFMVFHDNDLNPKLQIKWTEMGMYFSFLFTIN